MRTGNLTAVRLGRSKSASASGNAQLDVIADGNRASLARIAEFREEFPNKQRGFKDFSKLKHDFPFIGFVPCRAAGVDFVLFHADDDVVAWEYLWFGDDAYEPEITAQWVEWARGAKLIYDIGAYSGLMSVIAGKVAPGAKIHLFEPMDRTIERAKVNLVANSLAGRRMTLHNRAASSDAGKVDINLYRNEDFLGTGNSIYDKGVPIRAVKTIETVVVDQYLPGKLPDLVKIDVEGHELQTLRGMEQTILAARPRMILESWEHDRQEVLVLLESWGYECIPFEKREKRVMNFACVPR